MATAFLEGVTGGSPSDFLAQRDPAEVDGFLALVIDLAARLRSDDAPPIRCDGINGAATAISGDDGPTWVPVIAADPAEVLGPLVGGLVTSLSGPGVHHRSDGDR